MFAMGGDSCLFPVKQLFYSRGNVHTYWGLDMKDSCVVLKECFQ